MLEVAAEAYDSLDARAMVAALHDDVLVRYAEDATEEDEGDPEDDPESGLGPESFEPPGGRFLVARSDGRPVGCAGLRRVDATTAELKRMWVEPGARRTGVATALLAGIEAAAAEQGFERLQLATGLRQPEAMALYEWAGWRRIAPYGFYRDDPLVACYGKDLRP